MDELLLPTGLPNLLVSGLGFGFLRPLQGAYFRRSIAYMAQASFSTGPRSHLLRVGVRRNDGRTNR